MATSIPRLVTLLALVLVLIVVGKRYGANPPSDPRALPVVLIGVDGLEWRLVLELVREGRMPVLAGLMERGRYGYLETLERTLSPIVWTTVATGKQPKQHGIRGFVKRREGSQELYTNGDRKTKAVWNVLSDAGKTVDCVGWWMTFPAEPIRGTMVAQTNTRGQIRPGGPAMPWKGTLVQGLDGQVTPVEDQNRVIALARDVETALPQRVKETFGEFRHVVSPANRLRWEQSQWSLRADSIYLGVTRDLLARRQAPPDLLMVYFGAPDVMGHRFWRHAFPEDFVHPPSPEELADFGAILADTYAWVDRAIGSILEAYDEHARVFVVSDHGMHAINRQNDFAANPAHFTGHHTRHPAGVLIAAGPTIRRQTNGSGVAEASLADLPELGSVIDVTPTLLALVGVPLGEDMAGQVMSEVVEGDFLESHPPSSVATHDTPEWLASRPQQALSADAEEQRLEQLRALGYIE